MGATRMQGGSFQARDLYAKFVLMRAGCENIRVEQAYAAIPRELFLGPRPWWVPTRNGYIIATPQDPYFANQDLIIALDKRTQTHNSKPSMQARMLCSVFPKAGERVIHIGAGTGYYTAILAYIVGRTGHVTAYELDPKLARRAADQLRSCPWITLLACSGLSAALPAADIIYVNVAVTCLHPAWLQALAPGGRLLFPLQAMDGTGMMLLLTRPVSGGHWPASFICRSGVGVPDGKPATEQSQALSKAYTEGPWRDVHSLRFDAVSAPSCWLQGDGWWLSTLPPDAV